jgi:hypothetical protein
LERASRSLAKGSRMDVAESMALGRMSRMRGDGTLELVPIPADKPLGTTSTDSNVPTFSVQAFVDAAGVSWAKSSSLMKLVTLAAVCNKAKYDQGDQKDSSASGKHVAVPMFAGGVEDRKVRGWAMFVCILHPLAQYPCMSVWKLHSMQDHMCEWRLIFYVFTRRHMVQ